MKVTKLNDYPSLHPDEESEESDGIVRKLSRERADIVREHVIAVIRADGGEGDIVQDDLGDIAEIRSVGREVWPSVERH